MFSGGKRIIGGLLWGLILIATVGFSVNPAEAATKLRFTTYDPPQGMEGQMAEWLMAKVEEKSGGQLTFEKYFGGSLLQARETLKGIQSGAADMGYIFVPYFPRELPAWTVAEPFLDGPVAPEKRAEFFWALYEQSPELKKSLARWNQTLVAVHVFGKHSVGGPSPLSGLADLKNLKVRCAGGFDALHMSSLGAKVVFLKGAEVYSAMQKGAIDANYTPVTSYFKYKLYEIGKKHHLLVVPQFIGSVALITMSQKSFEALTPEQQKIILETGREYSRVESQKIRALEDEYSAKMIQAGCTIVEVPKAEVAQWAKECDQASRDKWIENTGDQGGGQAFLDLAQKLLNQYQD